MSEDVEIEMSPLCRVLESDGISVQVDIYRIPEGPWALEVIDNSGTSIVWEETFASDEAAWSEFQKDVQIDGLAQAVKGED